MNILELIDKKLEDAEKSATLETAGFGSPDDLIEVKRVLFGDDRHGNEGDIIHPTEYIRNITKLHHETWIISPIREVRAILKLHYALIQDVEELRGVFETSALLEITERLTERAKSCLRR